MRARTNSVPHAELEHARTTASAMFPDARCVATWTPGAALSAVCVEIWTAKGTAKVVPWAKGVPAQ